MSSLLEHYRGAKEEDEVNVPTSSLTYKSSSCIYGIPHKIDRATRQAINSGGLSLYIYVRNARIKMDCIALALHISIRPAYIYTLQHCVVGFSCFIACLFVEMRQTQPFSTQSLIGEINRYKMLIKNLFSLFCGSESQDWRSDCAPDVIEEKEHIDYT